MYRKASLLFLGFAITSAGYGVWGCSSDDNGTTSADGGTDTGTVVRRDTGAGLNSYCSGDLPTLTVVEDGGAQGEPDWSCYAPDASFLFVRNTADDGGPGPDAGDDAASDGGDGGSDAAAPDAAAPTDGGSDAAPGNDAGSGDSGSAVDAGSLYELEVLEFVYRTPLPGASVQVHFGASTGTPVDFSGVTDSNGLLPFPTPTSPTLSFSATGSGLYPIYFYDQPIPPPSGGKPSITIGYSILQSNDTTLAEAVLGSEPPVPTLATIVAAMRDCRGRDVKGGVITLIDGATNQALTTDPSSTGLKLTYFDQSGLPNPECTYSTNESQAVWSALNAPVNMTPPTSPTQSVTPSHPYSLQFSGRRGDLNQTQAEVLYTINLELWPGSGNVPRPFRLSPVQ